MIPPWVTSAETRVLGGALSLTSSKTTPAVSAAPPTASPTTPKVACRSASSWLASACARVPEQAPAGPRQGHAHARQDPAAGGDRVARGLGLGSQSQRLSRLGRRLALGRSLLLGREARGLRLTLGRLARRHLLG